MKKFVSTLLVFALMLVFSTSAFAAKGIGDTEADAITLFHPSDITLYITDSKDQDWFKWTNNTGQMKSFRAFLNASGDTENVRFGFLIEYSNGTKTKLMYAEALPSSTQVLKDVYVPDGANLYFVIGKTNDITTQYKLTFRVLDI